MNTSDHLVGMYPGSEAKCTRYSGTATPEMIDKGLENGEFEAAVGKTAIGICTTTKDGHICNGVFVLSKGEQIARPLSCLLRPYTESEQESIA